MRGELAGGLVDLLGQLAGGRQHQGAHLAPGAVEQVVQDGQHERRGLAGTGLGHAKDVTSVADLGDGG